MKLRVGLVLFVIVIGALLLTQQLSPPHAVQSSTQLVPVWATQVTVTPIGYGGRCLAVDDWNSDGILDLVVAAYNKFGLNGGYAEVLSGKTGERVSSLNPRFLSRSFGQTLVQVKLQNSSVVISTGRSLMRCERHAEADSEAVVCEEIGGSARWRGWMESIVGVGDVDGDQVEDYVVGSGATQEVGPSGSAELINSRSALRGWRMRGASEGDRLGTGVVSVHDIDEDGIDDVAILGERVCVFVSVRSGRELATLRGGTSFADCVTACSDVTGDGRPELLIAEPALQTAAGTGVVHVIDSSSLVSIASIAGPAGTEAFGSSVIEADDMVGDEKRELCVVGYSSEYYPQLLLVNLDQRSAVELGVFGMAGDEVVSGCSVGDVDNDEFTDIALGLSRGTLPDDMNGYVIMLSPAAALMSANMPRGASR